MAEQNTPSSTGSTPNSDVEQFTFERAIEELESIVRRLEDGKVPLEESVAITSAAKRSNAVVKICCGKPKRACKRYARHNRRTYRY